jgi:hypothetical protein
VRVIWTLYYHILTSGYVFTNTRGICTLYTVYFIKRSIAEISCPCLALFKGSPKTWRCLTGYWPFYLNDYIVYLTK